jgi:5-hmdU DNA kinase, helical domain
MQPVPRERIYDLYWYFAAERQRIFMNRIKDEPAPWTDDPILAEYKFCNVYRATDRVSQYLIRNVAYDDEAADPADALFRILAFRMFSRNETWDAIVAFLGRQPTIDDLCDDRFERAVEFARKQYGKLYTGAFILCANQAYDFREKHRNHIALFRHMFVRDRLGETLLEAPGLAAVFHLLRAYPLMGNFMSYQIAIDLNYSSLINFDENDFVVAGPGAQRGIRKVFDSTGDLSNEAIINSMVERQDEEFARLGLPFENLWGRKLHAIDCQGLFCEVDKYCRVAAPELASARSRIKTRYRPAAKPLPLFFPPKWGINSKLPQPL